jgi:hypothetical protein
MEREEVFFVRMENPSKKEVFIETMGRTATKHHPSNTCRRSS